MTVFSNYNSPEYQKVKDVFNTLPMMDSYIANIIEEYIYITIKEYYPSEKGGGISCEYRTKFGKIHGECKVWWSTGQLWIQTTYIDGKKHGEYKEWCRNGNLWIQTTYIDGKKHGEYKRLFPNGQLHVQTFYVDNKRHGKYKEWWRNGWLCDQTIYIDGVEVSNTN